MEATPYRGFGDEQDPWQPGMPPELAEGPPSNPTGWAAIWPWGLHGIIETVEVLALALLMFLLVRSVAQNFVVDGGSMQPTFHDGEMLIVNKLAYRTFDVSWLPFTDKHDWRPFGVPHPGDVVVFKFPQDQTRDFIKRVIAVPGQTVEVRGGHVYIDGVQQNEPYLDQAPTYDYGPTTVPEKQIFVLGDNRNNSYDSHSWGLLDQSLLIGRAEFRYWPLGAVGRVGHGGLSADAGVTINATEAPSSSSTAR
jgi:signal peptidase I